MKRFAYWIGGWPYVATAALLTYAALAASVAGTAVSAYGQAQQRKTLQQTSEYNAKLAENQAIQADLDQRENARRTRERNLQFQGSQRAAIAAAGVAETGSPLEVLAQTAGTLELQAQDEARASSNRYNAAFNQAAEIRLEGGAQARAIGTNMAGTILSGLSSFGGQYSQAKYLGTIKG